jgi:LPXTG-motif cell wall-anchored protein
MAFSPAGTVYLGNATLAYQFDPTTWVRVPNSPRATIGTTTIGATDLAACTSPSTISVEKNVVGRVNGADQFRLAVSAGSPLVESSVATTTGTLTGVQAARIGPTPVQINTSVTIAETMATGSVSPLTAYTSVYECWADGVRIFTGTEKSAAITIPNRLSVGVACTFSNSPAPFATVRVTKIVEDWSGANRTPTPGWTMTATATANTGSTVSILPSRNPAQQTGADGSATWQVLFGAASNRGRVTVAETTQTGFRYQSLACTVNGTAGATTVTTVGDQVRGALNVDIAPGNTVDCVYTNRPVATLTLVKNVSYGSAAPSAWQLAATRSIATALPGPTGAGGSGTLNAVTVSADTPYRLAETGGSPTYVQVGNWACTTASGAVVPVSAAGDVTLTRATAVTCTVTNATASITLLKNVQNPSPGFQPSTWNLTATPATLAGLSATTVNGADYSTTGNVASTFDVRPGHSYTLSESLAQSGTRLAYRQVRLEQRQTDGTWTPISSSAVTAPAAGQTAVYRFVNAPVQPTVLPLTGGASTDAFLFAGSAVLVLTLALAVWHGRRRVRRSVV